MTLLKKTPAKKKRTEIGKENGYGMGSTQKSSNEQSSKAPTDKYVFWM